MIKKTGGNSGDKPRMGTGKRRTNAADQVGFQENGLSMEGSIAVKMSQRFVNKGSDRFLFIMNAPLQEYLK
jgi:hypothetical protein